MYVCYVYLIKINQSINHSVFNFLLSQAVTKFQWEALSEGNKYRVCSFQLKSLVVLEAVR